MKLNQIELVQTLPSLPQKSTRIFHPPERYLGTILKDIEKIFLMKNRIHGDDSKTYDEVILDIDFEKWLKAIKSEK